MRNLNRHYGTWHQTVTISDAPAILRGGSIPLADQAGLAGPVGSPGSDRSNNGMDPSDPSTWVRPYNPQPGMMGRFNFDPFGVR